MSTRCGASVRTGTTSGPRCQDVETRRCSGARTLLNPGSLNGSRSAGSCSRLRWSKPNGPRATAGLCSASGRPSDQAPTWQLYAAARTRQAVERLEPLVDTWDYFSLWHEDG